METLKFKTTINCAGCIKAVTPSLNKLEGIQSWEVDTQQADKVLTVAGEGIDAETIRQAIEKAGFRAEPLR
ncbi:MAG: heavy-metal-associated domain-containing protein [Bacteroidetes bacterium]|nr:heavy-metal-associated domain-containing protein [Bacteroidota bacterium]MBS1629150.1 heavy-metal-associated domain-containing protein [Bacteroidota bacterium]